MAEKLVIDTDPGIGDAVAVALALFDPEVELLGITACAGQVTGSTATRNIQTIVELLDPPRWPRLGASESESIAVEPRYQADTDRFTALNGSTGLGEIALDVAELHNVRVAPKLLIDLVRESPHEITLLALGPLTNVQIASELHPGFLAQLKRLICLGGSISAGGDVTAAAEFNIFADPQAARNVFRSPGTKLLVPLDVSAQAVLTFEKFNRLMSETSSGLTRFLQNVLPFAFRAHHERLGVEGIRLNEVVALTAVTRPRLFGRRMLAVDIETDGELSRGATIADRRRGLNGWRKNIEVCLDVDVQGILDYFTSVVRRSAR